eukprot:6197007-Pleurochrysis_carterae.AAC.6
MATLQPTMQGRRTPRRKGNGRWLALHWQRRASRISVSLPGAHADARKYKARIDVWKFALTLVQQRFASHQ